MPSHQRNRGIKRQQPVLVSNKRKQAKKKTSILSLPDEPLKLIFSHLGAHDSSGSYGAPRDAFMLGLTNTRLLRLFGESITRITPDITNSTPSTLSPSHLLSVARLVGDNLLEIHLVGCAETLPVLSKACPRLETLNMIDSPSCSKEGLSDMLRQSLRSISVTHPTRELLGFLIPAPQEVSLYEVEGKSYSAVVAILEQPPKRRFHIKLADFSSDSVLSRSFIRLRRNLRDAIPKIESVYVKMSPDQGELYRRPFSSEAKRLITTARENGNENSLCKSIKLEGRQAYGLIKHAHPKADIELSHWEETFADKGEGIFAKKLALVEWNVRTDLSGLEEVHSEFFWCPRWEATLQKMRLKRAYFKHLQVAKHLSISAETVEIPFRFFGLEEWGWLKGISRVRIVGSAEGFLSPTRQTTFIRQLKALLDQFTGASVWIDEQKSEFFRYDENARPSDLNIQRLIASVRRFERSGGDAGTVKAMIDNVLI